MRLTKVLVRYESSLADLAGCKSEVFDLPAGATIAELQRMLEKKHGSAVLGAEREYQWRHSTSYVLFCVEGISRSEEELAEIKAVEGMVVSLIPPLAGG